MSRLVNYWYQNHWTTYFLRPLSWAYRGVMAIRRWCYQLGWKRSAKLPVPVIVVGNITVGGTGKTPLVAWMARVLREQGYRPGLVSRGYGGKSKVWPQSVAPHSDPGLVGDESVMLVRQTNCPMVVGPDRVAAARHLLNSYDCNVIISDDGLQHYALERDLEIAVIDAERGLGNQCCLPAGPLRENKKRLERVDMVVANGEGSEAEYHMNLKPRTIYNLLNPERELVLNPLEPQTLHAVAGIGNPQRFFETLRTLGFHVIEHPFPDHSAFVLKDIDFGVGATVVMTEKDAVKCQGFADHRHWCLAVVAEPNQIFQDDLMQRLRETM